MAIKITQPFSFDAQLPNFERDVFNSMQYSNNSPLRMTETEKVTIGSQYEIGHIAFDEYTKRHYLWLGTVDGWAEPTVSMVKVKFSDVDIATETLYLDNTDRTLADGFGNAVYVPVDAQPSDWNENYGNYYQFDTTTHKYVPNISSTYDTSITYYVLIIK